MATNDQPACIRLTRRQADILALAAEGRSDKEIAAKLGISVTTIRTHLERFYKANHVHNRAEAVAMLLQHRDT